MGGRRKKGRKVSGWIVLDKDYDMGSTEAVSKVRWLFQAQKAGHAGTLDPLATGILPIALGEATKTVTYVMEAQKTYQFTAQWGVSTTTDDKEGEIIATSDKLPSQAEIEAILDDFIGEIEQIPPQFSAVKINGQRAYDLARNGEQVEIEPRTITVHDLKIIDFPSADQCVFEAQTGKGTYVRALVRDIAKKLGTQGHIISLRRSSVGPFHEENAIKISDLEKYDAPDESGFCDRDECLEGIELALRDMASTSIDGPQAHKLRHGQAAIATPAQAKGLRGEQSGVIDGVLATLHGEAVAICQLDGLKLVPIRVFNL